MVKTVVERLVGLPERYDIVEDVFERGLLDEKTGYKRGDGLHVCLVHTQACDLGRSQAEPARMIPIFRPIGGDQILVGDNVGACQALGDFEATAKLAHVCYDLMGGSIAFVRSKDRDTSTRQGCSKGLGVTHDLGHVGIAISDHFGCGYCQGGHPVDLVRSCQHGKYSVGKRSGQLGVIPHHDPALWATECLPSRACHHRGSLAQWVLKLTTGDKAQLVGAIEEDVSTPFGNNV